MNIEEKKFDLYLTVLRFLKFKVTENLKRIYLDFDMDSHKMLLTAFYQIYPSDLELELLDDIVTNSNAHIPDFFIESSIRLVKELDDDENKKHDFIIFGVYYE
jgi:hypothetical protein